MAILDTTFLTFDAKGIREQLSDVIYNVSPEETPLVSMMAKDKVDGVLNEWQNDALAAAVTTNAQLEGDNYAAYPALTATSRFGNYQMISHKLFSVSGTEERVQKAGRGSEISYQTAKKGAEMKLDIEAYLFSASVANSGNATTARKTAPLNSWVKTNVDKASDGGNPTYTSGVPAAARTDGTQRALTETIFKAVMQTGWTNGANFKWAMVGPVNKGKVSAFAGIATATYNIEQPTRSGQSVAIIGAADVYVSDFGTVTVIPTRNQRERDCWFIDPEFLQLDHLRPYHREEMAKTGDARNFALRVEWGLRVKNEKALGLAADLTTT